MDSDYHPFFLMCLQNDGGEMLNDILICLYTG